MIEEVDGKVAADAAVAEVVAKKVGGCKLHRLGPVEGRYLHRVERDRSDQHRKAQAQPRAEGHRHQAPVGEIVKSRWWQGSPAAMRAGDEKVDDLGGEQFPELLLVEEKPVGG